MGMADQVQPNREVEVLRRAHMGSEIGSPRLLPSQGAAPTNTAWHPSFATRFNSRTAKPASRNEICAAGISRSLCEEQISSAHVLYARQSASANTGSLTAASHSRPTVG